MKALQAAQGTAGRSIRNSSSFTNYSLNILSVADLQVGDGDAFPFHGR